MSMSEFIPYEYRVYRNINGRFEAQFLVDNEWRHIANKVPGAGVLGVWVPSYELPDYGDPEKAKVACHTHAKKRKSKWLNEKNAGVVEYLGKLP